VLGLAKMSAIDPTFWRGKRVFITGHTGFKGSWLSLWLQQLGAQVKGFALPAPTNPSVFDLCDVANGMESEIADIRDLEVIRQSMASFSPEILIHMAAQPLVRHSYLDPVETYQTNVLGTVNVLEAARSVDNLKVIINITTDKCYHNNEWEWGYRENDPMGGDDPYSSSKGCAELVSAAYKKSFFDLAEKPKRIATVRAGNVIGGGDWAEDRLIPDILKSFEKAESVKLRNPHAIRPWQHVLEPLSGYLMLVEQLWNVGDDYLSAWNFGPHQESMITVGLIAESMASQWGSGAKVEMDAGNHPHEASILKLDISRAMSQLGWAPKLSLQQALGLIIEWHKAYIENRNMREITLQQIKVFNDE